MLPGLNFPGAGSTELTDELRAEGVARDMVLQSEQARRYAGRRSDRDRPLVHADATPAAVDAHSPVVQGETSPELELAEVTDLDVTVAVVDA
ncbi:hypothetical protein QJS66_01670 [Kocuria rhizophila]|nr:hypothetical protein QJS66_01670 [Kocuria rhizophila]